MVDELIDESIFLHLPFSKQTELISQYCNSIKEKIFRTSTLAEAQKIADKQCLQFQHDCSSNVLRNAMTEYVQSLVRRTWF